MKFEELNDVEQLNYTNYFENVNDLRLSPSALRLLLESPKLYFNDYVLGNKEQKKGKHFDEGSLVHCMVLEPDEVSEKFVNMGVPTPSDNTKLCIDHLLSLGRNASELEEYGEEIIEYLKEINLHQALVDDKKPGKDGMLYTGDEKRIAKIINDNTKEYFRLMVEAREKTIVDAASWDKCYKKAQAILANPEALFLLRTFNDKEEIRYELELNNDGSNFLKYGIKGILDSIKVDRENKIIYISDLKTTNSLLKDFPASAEKYDYWLQAAIYKMLANTLTQGAAFDYKIVFNFIVVDRNDDVYCFKVTDETLEKWIEDAKELFNVKVHYHISNKDFTLPYEFANNLITL